MMHGQTQIMFKILGYFCGAIYSDINSRMSINAGRKYDDIICDDGAIYCTADGPNCKNTDDVGIMKH